MLESNCVWAVRRMQQLRYGLVDLFCCHCVPYHCHCCQICGGIDRSRRELTLAFCAQKPIRIARKFSTQRLSFKGLGPRQCMQRRVRQQTATVAFWGGGDDKRPSTKNVLDTTMAWGDILTLLATELVMSVSPFAPSVGGLPVIAIVST